MAGYATSVSIESKIIYIARIIPYSYYMEPPRTIPTTKFEPLRMVVIY